VIKLDSTDPKDILNASRCFLSCVSPGMRLPLKTFQLNQAVIAAAPPCSTITPPVILSVTPSIINNHLLVAWVQPANPGSLITSYTVCLSTTAGGPYTNCKTTGAGTHHSHFNGLDAGTTYYAVVRANSFEGCSSANSNEMSGTTNGSPAVCADGTTAANDWATRVVANGGAAPSAATKAAIADFVCGCIADGIYSKFLAVNPIAPDSLIAAYTPLIAGPGLALWTDPSPAHAISITINGLVGSAANSSFVRTGVKTTDFTSPQDTAWGLYVYTASNTGYSGGSYNETKGIIGAAKFGGNSSWTAGAFPANGISVASPGNGFYSDIRVAGNDHRLYFFNSLNPHAQIGATDVTAWAGVFVDAADGMILFAINDILGSQQLLSDDIISFAYWAQGFTAANSAALAARIQTFRTAVGGGFR